MSGWTSWWWNCFSGYAEMRAALLGIDSGTQSTKAILVEADTGLVLSLGRAPHALTAVTPGQKEQEPQWWVEALTRSVQEALASAPGVEVLGIGVSGQQHGLVMLDGSDAVLRPAKLWNDVTSAPQCERLVDRLGGRDATIRLIGNAILPGYTAGKVLWVREHELEIYGRMRWILLPHDFLNLWLTGERFMECGDASGTAFFDVRRRHWSRDVLVALDADRDLATCLPPLLESNRLGGRLRPPAARALGLPAGIPVSTGGGDNMMAAIGTGNTRTGAVTVSLGTSGTIFAYAEVPVVDPGGELAAFCDSTGAWLPLVCTMNVTSSTEMLGPWFNLGMPDLTREAGRVPAGADGLIFLPYLEGERTPNMPGATGVLYGLRKGTDSPGHLMRAAMEGATLGLRYGLDILRRLGIDPQRISLAGGGAQNPVWRQICADVFSTPVVRSTVEEAAAYGAALQAHWALACDKSGHPSSLPEIAAAWAAAMQEATSHDPDPESTRRYDEVYDLFRRLTDHLKTIFAMTPV
jgi:xylulokinase